MPSSSRKVQSPQLPTDLPKLIVPRSEAQHKLEVHIEKGSEIVNRSINSQMEIDYAKADGENWWDYTITMLAKLFDNPSISLDYQDKTRLISISLYGMHYTEEREIFKKRMSSRVRNLESILQRLNLYEESTVASQYNPSSDIRNPQAVALEKIELIANRFHIVARQLCHRHADRDTLMISDEYDVQDLFHALLRLFFEDIRDEEWTPSYAGGASRIDFLLKKEQVVIELKMTRPGLKAKEVSDQLIIDTDRYQAHPDCKMLVAFVYDPQEYLTNPRGLEHDLTKTINGVLVKVIINPR